MKTDNLLIEVVAELRERLVYLNELGVESIGISIADLAPEMARITASTGQPISNNLRSEIADLKPHPQQPASQERAAGSRLAELPSLKARKPSKFFDRYNPREEVGRRESRVGSETGKLKIEVISERADVTETIAEIQAEIGPNCTRCKLSQLGRTQVVNSVGDPNAQLMFCGEAPGADEDRLGEPFVGRAGQLLTDIIEKGLGIPRKDVFIGNINRCRPPGNRAPEADECSACKPFLLREIAVVRPKVIVVLGATAAQNLLETKTPIGKLRGKFHDFMGSKVMPTFHPAYLLRDPNKKREVWEDMKLVKEYLRNN
jgi:uracil-DNA glycosylase family 4